MTKEKIQSSAAPSSPSTSHRQRLGTCKEHGLSHIGARSTAGRDVTAAPTHADTTGAPALS